MAMARKLRPVKCMERYGSWCAVTRRTYQGEETASVRTVCGKYVTIPAPAKRSVPDCNDCHHILLVADEAIDRSKS